MQTESGKAASQTLDRGLQILDVLAEANGTLTIADVATGIGVHRSVAYRLVRTLQDRGLVIRDAAGALRIGPHVATLARSVAADLQSAAAPELRALADALSMTAFLVVLDQQECVTLTTAEPRTPEPGPVLANYGLENLRFLTPVSPGDSIRVELTAKQITPRETDEYGEVRWDAVLKNQEDAVVATYDVLTLVPKELVAT